MSRIGKIPVAVPAGVEVKIDTDTITVKGKKGELTMHYEPQYVAFKHEGSEVTVTRADDSKPAKSRHGLYRSNFLNLVEGVTEGFSKTLEIRGVGYRAALKGKDIELSLGFSHSVLHKVPEGITITFAEKSQTVFTVSGIDKQQVGQVAAEIRSYRKPEPYKGKGIRYQDEYVLRKAGKSGKAA